MLCGENSYHHFSIALKPFLEDKTFVKKQNFYKNTPGSFSSLLKENNFVFGEVKKAVTQRKHAVLALTYVICK